MFVASPEQSQLTQTQSSPEQSIPTDLICSQVTVASADIPFSQMSDIEAEFETSFVELSLQDEAEKKWKDESFDLNQMLLKKVPDENKNLDTDASMHLDEG